MERSSTEAAFSAAPLVEMWRVLREARRITLRASWRVGNLSLRKSAKLMTPYIPSRCGLRGLRFFALRGGATHSPRFVIPAKAGIRASLRTVIGKFGLTSTQSRAPQESPDRSLHGSPPVVPPARSLRDAGMTEVGNYRRDKNCRAE